MIIRKRLANVLAVCDKHGLFPQSDQFSIHRVEALLKLFWVKNPFFKFSERETFKSLKCNACNDLKERFQ